MKRNVYLFGLLVSLSCLLGACTSKKPAPSAATSSTPHSRLDQNKSQASSQSAPSSSQVEPAQEPQDQQVSPASSTPVPTQVELPSAVIGSWSGRTPQAETVSFTISADGRIHSLSDFDPSATLPNEDTTARITELLQVAEGTYFIKAYEGDIQALTPGITGRGGVGATVYMGFIVTDTTYTPINWVVPDGSEIDYSRWTSILDTVFYKQ